MNTRKCPQCGMVWNSADDGDWACERCTAKIPAPEKPPVILCTLKDKFICTPENCEKYEKGKCNQDKHGMRERE